MKTILQSESAECGLACLAMVASAYGDQTGVIGLRRRFSLSLKGIRLPQLIQIAEQLNFQPRPLRLELEQLAHLSTPCILHWDMNHFVVLKSVGHNKMVVLDPAFGERRLTFAAASKHFTGVAVELTPTIDFQPKKAAARITVRHLTGPIRNLRNSVAQLLALSLALQLFAMTTPFFMQWVIDQVLVSMDRDLLFVLGLGFSLAIIFQVGIGLLRGWVVVYLSSRLGLHWMGSVFAHLMRLPLEFFENRNLGDITSRLNSIQIIQRTLTTSFLEAIIDGSMAIVTLTLMLVYNWKLTFVTIFAMILYMAIRYLAYRPFRESAEQQLVAWSKQQTHLLESLRSMQSIKVAGRESQRRSIYSNLMVGTVNQEVRMARMNLGFLNAQQLIFGLERVAVIWVGAILTLQSVFSVGMLVAYLAYKELFTARMGTLIDKWVELRMLGLHGERLSDIVLTPPEEEQPFRHVLLTDDSSVEVESISFRYSDVDPWILKDCSLTVRSGESVAIVGASGCGKTTLIKLLLGLLEPTEGKVRIGGQDLRQAGPHNVRAAVGAVMQDDQLFAGTIADNIAFFDPETDQRRVEEVAILAEIHDEIAAMPMGYHSLIGDMGNSLSGGQKQRIILARALYRQPKLLFLDEATSHLDVMKERLINEAVRQLALTKLIVAHRPETIASADRVLVMEQGRIAQELRPQAPASAPAITEPA